MNLRDARGCRAATPGSRRSGGEGGFSVLNLDGDGANGEAVFSGEGEVGGGGESGAAEPRLSPHAHWSPFLR